MKQRRSRATCDEAAAGSLECLGRRLQALRCHYGVTQEWLASQLKVGQTSLSHMEQRDDVKLSTLSEYIRALGGQLHVAASFPRSGVVTLVGDASWQPAGEKLGSESEESSAHQLQLPSILGPEQLPPSRDVVFSIRPTHAEKILSGTKTVELRRRFTGGIRPGTLAIIYTTSPTRALTGFARIKDVERLSVGDLWKKHRSAVCLKKHDFEAYFSGLQLGYAIVLCSAKPLTRPIALSELRHRFGFEPPQSYQYASPYLRSLVGYDGPQATN